MGVSFINDMGELVVYLRRLFIVFSILTCIVMNLCGIFFISFYLGSSYAEHIIWVEVIPYSIYGFLAVFLIYLGAFYLSRFNMMNIVVEVFELNKA